MTRSGIDAGCRIHSGGRGCHGATVLGAVLTVLAIVCANDPARAQGLPAGSAPLAETRPPDAPEAPRTGPTDGSPAPGPVAAPADRPAPPDLPMVATPAPDRPATLPGVETAAPGALPPRLLAVDHAVRGVKHRFDLVLGPSLPLPHPGDGLRTWRDRMGTNLADRLPLPAPRTLASAFVAALPLRLGPGLPVTTASPAEIVTSISQTATGLVPGSLRAGISALWTPGFRAFLGRLWPMLIPLALFLAMLSTWRTSIREASAPPLPERATHPLVQARVARPPVHDDSAAADVGHRNLPPALPEPAAVARSGPSRPASPGTSRGQVRPPRPATARKPAPATLAPRDPLAAFLASTHPVPPTDPGTPQVIDGLVADEMLIIQMQATSGDGPDPDVSLDRTVTGVTRVLLDAQCVASIHGADSVSLDQISLVVIDPPAAWPRPSADIVALDAARADRRRRAASLAARSTPPPALAPVPPDGTSAPVPATGAPAPDPDDAITFDLDPVPAPVPAPVPGTWPRPIGPPGPPPAKASRPKAPVRRSDRSPN